MKILIGSCGIGPPSKRLSSKGGEAEKTAGKREGGGVDSSSSGGGVRTTKTIAKGKKVKRLTQKLPTQTRVKGRDFPRKRRGGRLGTEKGPSFPLKLWLERR